MLVNGELDGCIEGTVQDGCTEGTVLRGWHMNNAALSIVDMGGRLGVLKVGDAGSFSDISQV